jgi:hypothetical protein
VPDPLRIEPHPESERSYHEQREQFRAENLKRIQSLLQDYRLNGVRMKIMGTPLALEGATTPELRAKALLKALDEAVVQDFGLAEVPPDIREQLDSLIEECDLFEKMALPEGEGTDHDAPALPVPVEMLTEEEIIQYVDDSIEESKREV